MVQASGLLTNTLSAWPRCVIATTVVYRFYLIADLAKSRKTAYTAHQENWQTSMAGTFVPGGYGHRLYSNWAWIQLFWWGSSTSTISRRYWTLNLVRMSLDLKVTVCHFYATIENPQFVIPWVCLKIDTRPCDESSQEIIDGLYAAGKRSADSRAGSFSKANSWPIFAFGRIMSSRDIKN